VPARPHWGRKGEAASEKIVTVIRNDFSHILPQVFLCDFLNELYNHSPMLETLITNKTRIKLLYRLFLNPDAKGYLRGLEEEFGESSNAIRIELNRFEAAGMLDSYLEKNKKIYQANKKHPMYSLVNEIIYKQLGFDQILEKIIQKLGNVDKVYLTGPVAKGINKGPLEIVLIGDKINVKNLNLLIEKVEKSIGRNITHMIYKSVDLKASQFKKNDWLLLWDLN